MLEAVAEAVEQVFEARKFEGSALKAHLERRLAQAEQFVEEVARRANQVEEHYRAKLRARLEEMLGELELDEARLAQEVVYYVEKSEITEEITRLRTHLERFSQYIQESNQGPVGKTLDFLCQEMNREINTILSKSGVVEISGIAIEAKGEIEKIREQVQNVE